MRCAEGVPSDITEACLLWQRGTKLQYTKMAAVSQGEGRVHWDQVLKQVLVLSHTLTLCFTQMPTHGALPGRSVPQFARSLTLVNTQRCCAWT